MKIRKAVIPAAGLGTRFLPITKSMPKEMLPIVDKPVIHYVVQEAIRSGIEDIIIITGRGKRSIEDYFDAAPELEMHLHRHGKQSPLGELEEISSFEGIHYIRQKDPLGLGHAILRAKKHIGESPFAVLLGDDIIADSNPCTAQLMKVFEKTSCSVLSIERIAEDKVSSYGIIKGSELGENLYQIEDIVEKPKKEHAPSTLGAVGRYIFTPAIFESLEKTPRGIGNEIQLTDAIRILLEKEPVYAYQFEGKRYDTGDLIGYLETVIDFALQDGRVREEFMAYLKTKLK